MQHALTLIKALTKGPVIMKTFTIKEIKDALLTTLPSTINVEALEKYPYNFCSMDTSHYAIHPDSIKHFVKMFGVQGMQYQQQVNDCDDFATLTKGLGGIWCGKSGSGHGSPIGLITVPGHALNVVLTASNKNQEKPTFVFLEPQTGKTKNLATWNTSLTRVWF